MLGKAVNLILGFGGMALMLLVAFWLMGKMAEWRSSFFKRDQPQTLFGSDDKKQT